MSLWFHGDAANSSERLYVAVSNTAGSAAVVYHDDSGATTVDTWTEWVIPLQTLADQGLNLTNVERIAVGVGNRSNPLAGGSGKMLFDDIRLYRPRN